MVCCSCSWCFLFCLVMKRSPRSTLFPYTTLFRSHVLRVQIYAAGVARLMGCDESEIEALRAGALLHDIGRSEEHTSELQSRRDLVCRLLLEKKNITRQFSQLLAAGADQPALEPLV